MTIVKKDQVLAAIERALKLDPSVEIAIAVVAASMCLPVELVREVVDEGETA